MFCGSIVLAAAIALQGVTGENLRARAYFDANNVTVGDPLVLTIDFLGEADFAALHPPALSRAVDRRDWKLDDASAKTDTFRDARRLTYRIRPMREGVLWFPALEFGYSGKDGVPRTVRANEIPVHARGGAQVVVEDMSEETGKMPAPPELVDVNSGTSGGDFASPLNEDEAFRWRKAMAKPTAAAFAEFDFPAARMNEATCELRAGNWARAMQIYTRLEWRVGQTPEIEKGMKAALALRYDNPDADLPAWREFLRPILRYGWMGRVGIVLGGFAALALFFWILGRGIRAVACVAVAVTLVGAATAETTETVTTNADGSVTVTKTVRNGSFSYTSSSTTGGTGLSPSARGGSLFGSDPFEMFENFDPFGHRRRQANRPKPQISVALAPERPSVTVGEDFNLVLTIELPRYVAISDGIRLSIAEQDKMQQVGAPQNLTNQPSRNPTNVICRMVFPMRANEPFEGLHYSVEGAYVFTQDRSFFQRSVPFASGNRLSPLTVKPLPTAGQPADFAGIVSEGLRIHETCDLLTVGTNDVVTITYRLFARGFVPEAFLPPGAAFEWGRRKGTGGNPTEIEYRRYFVADGAKETPRIGVSYYDPRTKTYKSAKTGGTPLAYRSAESEKASAAILKTNDPGRDAKGKGTK